MNQTNKLRFSSQKYVSNDATTCYEFANNFQRQEYLLPEMRLICAVLADAIECYQKYLGAKGRRKQRIFRETEAWIDSRDMRSPPYSFEQVCALLQLDPEYLRRGLRQWRAQREAGARRVNGAGTPLEKPNENSTAQAANAFF